MTEITLTFCPMCLSTKVTARKCQHVELDLLGREKPLSEPLLSVPTCKVCNTIACRVPVEVPDEVLRKLMGAFSNKDEKALLISFCILVLGNVSKLKYPNPVQNHLLRETARKAGFDEVRNILDLLGEVLKDNNKKIRARMLANFL